MTRLYEPHVPTQSRGSVLGYASLGSPPGVLLPATLETLLQDLVGTLGWTSAGVYTPWAMRSGDAVWVDIGSPETNIATFAINEAAVKQAQQVLFGTQLPFVLVLTSNLQPITKLQEILEDAPYDLFQTQAVYNQADSKTVPTVSYVHWLRAKDVDEQPRYPKSLDTVAAEMGAGRLMYGQQVPVETSTLRTPPVSFSTVLAQQSAPPVVSPGWPTTTTPTVPTTDPTTTTTTTTTTASMGGDEKLPWLGIAAVGVGAMFATVALGRALRK